MSKKIAQLTKVIYFLNTKNEDHSTELSSLTDAYEREIADVVQDAMHRMELSKARLQQDASQAEKAVQAELDALRRQSSQKEADLQRALLEQKESSDKYV